MRTRRIRRAHWRPLVVASAGALVASGCGIIGLPGGDDSGGRFGTGESFSVLAGLAEVPESAIGDTPTIEIRITDLLAATEVAGLTHPSGSTDSDLAFDWLGPLTGYGESPVFAELPFELVNSVGQLPEIKDDLGFTITDVDAIVDVVAAPGAFSILVGDLTPAGASEGADGIATIGEGEDFEVDIEARTAARPMGRPLRFGTSGSLLAMGLSTQAVAAWLDPESPRLDSNESLALAASALDEKAVVSAYLGQSDSWGGSNPSAISVEFDTIAIGSRSNDGAVELIVVYVMASDQEAEKASPELENLYLNGNLETYESPVSDVVVFESVETSGRVVIVTLSMPEDRQMPTLILRLVPQREVLFSYYSS